MLWSVIYDFFVMHIFGGYSSTGVLYGAPSGFLADLVTGDTTTYDSMAFIKVPFYDFDYDNSFNGYMLLGNYLSLISTIITMVIIVTLCALFIWKIVKLIGGLIR